MGASALLLPGLFRNERPKAPQKPKEPREPAATAPPLLMMGK